MRNICRYFLLVVLCAGCTSPQKSSHVRSTYNADTIGDADLHKVDVSSLDVASDATANVESHSGNLPDTDALLSDDEVLSEVLEHDFQFTSLQADQSTADSDSGTLLTDRSGDVTTAAPPDAADAEAHAIQFSEVIGAVYQSYPLLQSALYSRNIALGQQIGASGAFDTKLKGASENGPQGFYQTYRQSVGIVQPTYWGGEVFAGYRIGRGEFQPWYQERQTNGGGEFKAGVQIPLARNREIDARRAELWKAGYGRSLAEPEIQAQLIGFIQDASYAYWDWVAAGENHRIAKRILTLAEERTSRIEAQVNAGLVDPPELTDNLRLVAIRQAKTADTRRKMEQTASKLSVYFRDASGEPLVAGEQQLPGFPEPDPIDESTLSSDIQVAMSSRPELRMLDIVRQQTQVDFSEARNQMQPELNAVLIGSQDVGDPTSKKMDKSPYEGEASVYLDVPMQRRKARGKMTELQGKLAQIAAKRRITADKISVDVQMAHAALRSAWEQVERTREALRHAEDLASRERTNQEAGISDLLKVTLREQYAVESAEKNVDALKLYFESRADYRAAMAQDQINQ